MNHLEKAIQLGHKAINIYNDLTDTLPEKFTHYLATSIHNLGLFYFGQKEIELAEQYFNEALTLRKKLAQKEPEFFDADVCATALNLVELYQSEFENNLDFSLKSKCLELLTETENRLKEQNDDRLVLKSMKRDCQYYLDYFNTINIEQLRLDKTFRKVDDLLEEIKVTLLPEEKIAFQLNITALLEEQLEVYSQNEKLKNELAFAYNDLSWLYLRLKNFKKAEEIILKAQKLEQPIQALKCNLAHSYLLQDEFAKAKSTYLELINQRDNNNELYPLVILSDFEKLKKDGITNKDFDRIRDFLV
jgi:tetratricopeptide (TPR) repeat protein